MKLFVPMGSLLVLAISLSEFTNAASASAIVITAIFLGVVNVIAAWSAAKQAARKAIEPVAIKLAEMEPIVHKIEAHVNSETTRFQGVDATQKMQIELQREMIDELKKAAALLAQAKASADLTTVVAQAAVAGATTPTGPKVP